MENKEFNEIKTFKSFRNALVNAMKAEIAQLANEQREQKKTRKLANRPKDKSLGDIVEEIHNRAYKINNLLYHYRWVKHGLKYWANRDIHSFKEYYKSRDTLKIKYYYGVFCDEYNSWFAKHWDDVIQYGINKGQTHGEIICKNTMNQYKKYCEQYNIECSELNLYELMFNK